MALSIEKILTDARLLVTRLKDHDSTADSLLNQTQTLHQRMDAMKQYEDDITELNEIARHRPRSTLVLGIAQENRQIRELQHENRELRLALEEHQSALELIMSKYREQILKLITSNRLEQRAAQQDNVLDVSALLDKVCEMAAVMQRAVAVDDSTAADETERLTRLKQENEGLRELLDISYSVHAQPDPHSVSDGLGRGQATAREDPADTSTGSSASDDSQNTIQSGQSPKGS